MRKLLEFLVRIKHWFLFFLLEAVSIFLVVRDNAYQRNHRAYHLTNLFRAFLYGFEDG